MIFFKLSLHLTVLIILLFDVSLSDDSLEEHISTKLDDVVKETLSDYENKDVPHFDDIIELSNDDLVNSATTGSVDEYEASSDFNKNLADGNEQDKEVTNSGVAESVEKVFNISTTDNSGNCSSTTNHTSRKVLCEQLERERATIEVEIVDGFILPSILKNYPSITGRSSEAPCHLVYFYSSYCPFSVAGSPYVHGLARALPNIPLYGVDSIKYHNINTRYGVIGTPSLLLFHNGLIVGRYNASEYSTSNLMDFIHHFTNEKLDYINITSHDFTSGNLPTTVFQSPKYTLYLAWMFIIACGSWMFISSQTYAKIVEMLLNNWHEAEAQHAHED